MFLAEISADGCLDFELLNDLSVLLKHSAVSYNFKTYSFLIGGPTLPVDVYYFFISAIGTAGLVFLLF